MDWSTLATSLALVTIALLAGGAAVRLAGLLALRPAIAVLALVAVVLAGVVLWTAWSRERSGTPYW